MQVIGCRIKYSTPHNRKILNRNNTVIYQFSAMNTNTAICIGTVDIYIIIKDYGTACQSCSVHFHGFSVTILVKIHIIVITSVDINSTVTCTGNCTVQSDCSACCSIQPCIFTCCINIVINSIIYGIYCTVFV